MVPLSKKCQKGNGLDWKHLCFMEDDNFSRQILWSSLRTFYGGLPRPFRINSSDFAQGLGAKVHWLGEEGEREEGQNRKGDGWWMLFFVRLSVTQLCSNLLLCTLYIYMGHMYMKYECRQLWTLKMNMCKSFKSFSNYIIFRRYVSFRGGGGVSLIDSHGKSQCDGIRGKGPGVAGAESSNRELWFVGGVGKKPWWFDVTKDRTLKKK